MSIPIHRLAGCGCVVATASACAWAAGAPPAADEQPSVKTRRELSRLFAAFSRPGAKPADWIEAAERILEIGHSGPKRLLPVLTIKVQSLDRRYRAAFAKQAQRVRLAKLASAAKERGISRERLAAELKKHQRMVLDLAGAGNLTKARIEKEADAALAKLHAVLFVRREEALAASEPLAAQRRELLALAKLRDRAQSPVAGAGGKGDAAQAGPDAEAALADFEELAALLAMPMGRADRRTLLLNARRRRALRPQEAEGIRDLNRIRLLLGLHALEIDRKLCEAARGHSTDMKTRGFFSHTSPVAGKRSFADRAKQAGTSASAENIAYGPDSGQGVNRIWFHSPGHMKNMLGKHGRVGLGYDGGKWTQLFGR